MVRLGGLLILRNLPRTQFGIITYHLTHPATRRAYACWRWCLHRPFICFGHAYCRRRTDYIYRILWGNRFSEMLHIFSLICPWPELISEYVIFCVMSMAQQHDISGYFSAKRAIKLHKWPLGEAIVKRPWMSGRGMSGTSRRFPRHFWNCDSL